MLILVTGGAGYIGSHVCLALLDKGFDVVVADNLCNGNVEAIERVEKITGKTIDFHEVDIRDEDSLATVFWQHPIDAVIHLAGLKAVNDSVKNPLDYYDNNVVGTLSLCKVMKESGVKTLVFSSSSAVYGDATKVPVSEISDLNPVSPYGRSKLMVENVLKDLQASDSTWQIALLRYFNPVGAHLNGLIGDSPVTAINSLFTQIVKHRKSTLHVFGFDYDTVDGTCVRDYIHVVDLATGHLKALDYLRALHSLEKKYRSKEPFIWNLGTGHGYSVMQVIEAFESVIGERIPYLISPRRAGDIQACYADVSKANRELDWRAKKNIFEMCASAWNWHKLNPKGFN